MKKNVYFAHPMGYYDTPQELEFLKLIKGFFPDSEYNIINPNEDQHSRACRGSMHYFIQLVETQCAVVVAMPYPGKQICWGAGVWQEMKAAQDMNMPVYTIENGQLKPIDCNEFTPLGIYATAAKNREIQEELRDLMEFEYMKRFDENK